MSGSGLGGLPKFENRDAVKLLYESGWKDADKLLQMACTVMAESGCYPHAWHWNDPAQGGDGSTDWGLFQLNDGAAGGKAPQLASNGDPIAVTDFQKNALDPALAGQDARKLYEARGFEPWNGYAKWKNYAPAMTRALCNWLRVKYGIQILD